MKIAQLAKVNTQTLAISKFGKRLYWTSNSNNEPDNLQKLFKKNKKPKLLRFVPEKPQFNHMMLRKNDIMAFTLYNTVKLSLTKLLQRLYGQMKGYRKSTNMYAFSEFKYIWRRRKDYIFLRKTFDINLKYLTKSKIKFIFFPLTAEPETAMHGLAEDFFFQLSAINMLSRDLPSNYKIVVKEHLFAIGRRPDNFYEQIKELNNVLIADPLEYGISYLKKADAVALVVGTSGWEAAAMGLPVISFSKYNSYKFLDHVFTVSDPDDTKSILSRVCKKKYPNKKSIRDGAKMVDSYFKLSFQFKKVSPFQNWDDKNNGQYNLKFIDEIYRKLKL